MEEERDEIQQPKPKQHKRKKEDLYLIWEYYHKIQLTKDSVIKCVCKFCNRVYKHHMKRLINHLVRSCKKCPENIKIYIQTIAKKILENKEQDESKPKDDNQNEENVEECSGLEYLSIDKKTKNTKCFVFGCNRTRDEFAIFPAPTENRERGIWNSIIAHPFQQRDLKATDFICERHFAPSDVVRYLVVNGVRIPNKSPVLRHGCLPIKFFDDYVLKSYNRHITKLITKSKGNKKRKKRDEDENDRNSERRNKKSLNGLEVIEELAPNPEYEIEFEHEKSFQDSENPNEVPDIQNEEIVIKTETNDEIPLQDPLEIDIPNIDVGYNINMLIKSEICDMANSDVKDEVNDDSDSSDDEDVENNFFERIFETKSFPGLNDYWAIYPCKNNVKPILQNLVSENKSVVFTQMKVREGIPLTDKQIVLTKDLQLNYFVGHNQIQRDDLPLNISNTTELAAAINRYSILQSCEGGPGIFEIQIDFKTTTYYEDYSSQTWRHKLCDFCSLSGPICMHCKHIRTYLKRKLKLMSYAANKLKSKNGNNNLNSENISNEDLGKNDTKCSKEDNFQDV